jgi:hypothetical protein
MAPKSAFTFDAARMAPPDTILFVSLSDAAFLQKIMDSGFLAQFYDDRNTLRNPGGIHDHLKNWAQDLPITYEEWAQIFPGVECCYITGLEFRSDSPPVFDISFILEHNGDVEQATAFIEKLLKQLSPGGKKNQYIHNGVKVFTLDHHIRKSGRIASSPPHEGEKSDESSSSGQYNEGGIFQEFSYHFQYAFVDRRLFFCEGKGEPIKALVDRYKSQRPLTLSGVKTYKILFEEISDERCVKVYFNLEEIFKRFAAFYEKEGKNDLSRLSLEEFKGLGIAQYMTPYAFESRIRLYAPSQRTGVCEAFFQFRENSFSTLEFTPPDTIAFTSISLDLFRVYHVLLSAVGSLYPEEVVSLRQTIRANNLLLGLDLENQILGQMKGEMGYYIRKLTDPSGRDRTAEVFFVEVENPGLFRESLKKLFVFARNNLAMEMQEKKHLDTEYWTPAPMGNSVKQEDFIPSFGIFMHDKYLFATPDIPELHSLIARLKSGEGGVVSRDGLKEFMGRHPTRDCVGMRIVDQPVSQTILRGIQPLVERIDPGNPVQVLLESRAKGAYVGSLKTLVYQDRDMFSILTELPFSEVNSKKKDP